MTPTELKTISLYKGNELFLFRYEPGQESEVSSALLEFVRRSNFDWFDCAVLSHQLGQHLAKELQSYLPKKAVA